MTFLKQKSSKPNGGSEYIYNLDILFVGNKEEKSDMKGSKK